MKNGVAKIKERIITLADIDTIVSRLPKADADDAKRQLRKPLLNALDVYDKNVSKGRIYESPEMKQFIDSWYRNICDLKDEAFINIPMSVKKYSGA